MPELTSHLRAGGRELPCVTIFHTVRLLRRARRASLVEGLAEGPPGSAELSRAPNASLKLNRLELIFVLMISEGLLWSFISFIRDPQRFLGDEWGPRLMEVTEDESKLWTFLDVPLFCPTVSSPLMSYQSSANSPEVHQLFFSGGG